MARNISASELLAAWERGVRQSPLDRALTLLAATRPESSMEELARQSIGWRDSSLLALREQVFGSEVACLVRCQQCQENLELSLDTARLRVGPAATPELSVILPGFDIHLRLPNTEDLRAVAGLPLAEARAQLFGRCVLEARSREGAVPVGALPEEALAAAEQRMSEADPQADTVVAVSCPACGHEWRERFDITAFFWTELNAWAHCILREVHMLARAYGWRESDILALSPARRQIYLELVSA